MSVSPTLRVRLPPSGSIVCPVTAAFGGCGAVARKRRRSSPNCYPSPTLPPCGERACPHCPLSQLPHPHELGHLLLGVPDQIRKRSGGSAQRRHPLAVGPFGAGAPDRMRKKS